MPIPSGILESLTGGKAAEPPSFNGSIAVLAVPDMSAAEVMPKGSVSGGGALDPARLRGDDLTQGVEVPRGTAEAPTTVVYSYDAPQTMRSARIFIPGAKTMFAKATLAVALEASEDGQSWRKLADVPMTEVPSTVSFAPATARQFRLVLTPLPFSGSNMGAPAEGIIDINLLAPPKGNTNTLRQFTLSNAAAIDQFEAKAGFALVNDYFSLGGPKDGAQGPKAAQVIDVTSHVRPDGTLDWTPPKAIGASCGWAIRCWARRTTPRRPKPRVLRSTNSMARRCAATSTTIWACTRMRLGRACWASMAFARC
jgi:hypothetical protein